MAATYLGWIILGVPIDSRMVEHINQLTDSASINIAMHSLSLDDYYVMPNLKDF